MTNDISIAFSNERYPLRSTQVFIGDDGGEHLGKITKRWLCVDPEHGVTYRYEMRNVDAEFENLFEQDETVSLTDEAKKEIIYRKAMSLDVDALGKLINDMEQIIAGDR